MVEMPREVESTVFFGGEDKSEESPCAESDDVHIRFEDQEATVNRE